MSQHLPLLALLSVPPGNEMSPPTPKPKPMRGAAFLTLVIPHTAYGNKTAGLHRSQKWHFLSQFSLELKDALRGYWVHTSLLRTTSYLQRILEAPTLGWRKGKGCWENKLHWIHQSVSSPEYWLSQPIITAEPAGAGASSHLPQRSASFSSQLPLQWRHAGSLKLAMEWGYTPGKVVKCCKFPYSPPPETQLSNIYQPTTGFN